jgi:putative membrane protein
MKRFLSGIGLFLKGMAMGAADVVPGVSGGTIAFITGIYEELISSIRSIDHHFLKLLLRGNIVKAFNHINGKFLITLFAGIFVSILSLARLIKYLLENEPIMVWSFFFGLILASIWIMIKKIRNWSFDITVALVVGLATAYYITIATPSQGPDTYGYIFLSGMIAICAMILPGISGSFILLLMGSYSTILGAVTDMDFMLIGIFMLGAVIGITSFSHVLNWAFKKYHDATVALLTGFMIGSLNKVWPWKNVISTRVDRHGEVVPLMEESVLPKYFEGDPQLLTAVFMAVIGIIAIFLLDRYGMQESDE